MGLWMRERIFFLQKSTSLRDLRPDREQGWPNEAEPQRPDRGGSRRIEPGPGRRWPETGGSKSGRGRAGRRRPDQSRAGAEQRPAQRQLLFRPSDVVWRGPSAYGAFVGPKESDRSDIRIAEQFRITPPRANEWSRKRDHLSPRSDAVFR